MSIHRHGPRFPAAPVSSLREERKVADLAAERDRRRSMETPDSELVETRDQMDKAWEAWSGNQAPLTEREARHAVAREVDAARGKLLAALKHADRDDLRGLHVQVAIVALEVEALQSDLVDGGDAA